MDWVIEFYEKQNRWSGVYSGEITGAHREKATRIGLIVGPGSRRILELGAGGCHVAAATAELGHHVVAVELVPSLAENGRRLAQTVESGTLEVLNEDFYTVSLEQPFDAVCYWDGFGIGSDEDQRRLLNRIAGWLRPEGLALIDVDTPWYAASVHGRGWEVGDARREYSFDADGCRWEDTWHPIGKPEEAVRQSLRCYSPADLRLLLAGTGLVLEDIWPGGTMDWEAGEWLPMVPLRRSMFYVAVLRHENFQRR